LGWVGRENILAENESGYPAKEQYGPSHAVYRYTVTPTSNPISDLVALNPLSDSARDELDRMASSGLLVSRV
jgi:hypothetical protein